MSKWTGWCTTIRGSMYDYICKETIAARRIRTRTTTGNASYVDKGNKEIRAHTKLDLKYR